jgi:hypothetical protein
LTFGFYLIFWAPDTRVKAPFFANGFEFTKFFNKVGASAVSMTPLVLPQWIQLCKLGSKSYRTSGVIDTAGAASAVKLTSLVPPHWCH